MINDKNKIMNKEGKYVWGDNGNARIPTKEYKDNFDAIFGKKSSTSSVGKKEQKVDASEQKRRQDVRGRVLNPESLL